MAYTLEPAVLHGMALFATLDGPALADVAGTAQSRHIIRGKRIFAQGDAGAGGHVLISGRVKIVQTDGDGQQVVMRVIGPGEMFGTLAMFTGGSYPADAIALSDCVEMQWAAPAMIALMERYPRIALNALTIVGKRLVEVQDRLAEVSGERVERRIARALLRLVRQAGRPVASPENAVEIDFPLSRQDLAEMTGTTLHTVSRILSGWEGQGIVKCARQQVIVRQPGMLERIAEGTVDDAGQPPAG